MKQKFFAIAVMMLTLIFSSVTFAGYWKVADNQVPAYRDSNLTQRTGNEAVYKGDRIYVHQEQGRAYEVSYPVGNSGKYKKRWVSKAVFNLTAPTRPIQPVTRPATNKYARISGDFYLVVDNGGRHVVDVPFNSHNAGTFLQIYSKNDGAAQKFTIKPVSGEWHSITHKDSGLVMNVYYGRPDNGNKVWLYQYDGTPASLWRFRDLGNGIYNIESQLSGNPFLEVQSNNPFDGAVLQLWQQHTGQAARWKLVKAGATNKANFQFANYSLTSPANYQLRFTGNLWDANNQSAITGVHVYIGGGAGGGGDFLGQFQANGSNHSFNTTLNVPQNRSGNQLVVIYAVNGTESKELDRRNINIAPSSSGNWQWPINNVKVTQKFANYYERKAKAGRPYHCGIDIKNSKDNGNPPIYVAASGTVKYKNFTKSNGNHVIIRHNINGKTVYTLYSHLDSFNGCPNVGQSVTKGQQIGTMGVTGDSTGLHLHFAIFEGESNDPVGYAAQRETGNLLSLIHNGKIFYDPEYVIENGRLP